MSSHELQRTTSIVDTAHEGTMPGMRAGVIGAGAVGMSVAMVLHARGHLAWIVARSPRRRTECRMAFASVPVLASCADIASLPDWILISTPDAVIAPVARECSEAGAWSHVDPATDRQSDPVVISHCAGALHADVIAAAWTVGADRPAARRAIFAATHPFQTFPYVSERHTHGIAWGIECAPQSVATDERRVASLVRCIGGTPVVLTPTARDRKEIYHSVAVVASNYLTAVSAVAREAAHAADIPPLEFLQPIMRTAMESALMSIARDAAPQLTGPIARGDTATVMTHCQAMRSAGEHALLRSYVLMALVTADYAAREGFIDAAAHETMRATLERELTRRS
ncbi:MAG: DUF2520 domain-containing protein [Candidatus Kapaibacterium sp.]